MEKQEVVFWTYASKKFESAFNAMKNSLMKFHSDIPLVRYTEEDAIRLSKEYPKFKIGKMNAYPLFSYLQGKKYKKVIHIDSDILVCSPLKEVFEGDYDVAGILHGNLLSYNLGFFVSTSEEFNELYLKECDENYTKYSSGEQGVFNDLAKKTNFKFKKLDDGEGVYHTGISENLMSVTTDGKFLYYKSKPIRIIHVCANWGTKLKLELDFTGKVNNDVLKVINYLKS